MRKVYYLVLMLVLICACKKDDEKTQAEIDDEIIIEYLNTQGLSATKHESGLYFIIHKEGTGGHPNISHTVVVDYKGYLTDGTVFDQSNNAVELPLSQLIIGWQIGINLLKPGGEGTFFIPSDLGYGNSQVGAIPPNSVLIFEVELVEFY